MDFPKKIKSILQDDNYTMDETGLSGAGVHLFSDKVLKVQPISEEAINEAQMLAWLCDKLPVPKIIEHIVENGKSYILMSKCSGKMTCDSRYMQDPAQQTRILASALKMLWETDIAECPCNWSLERRLAIAEENIRNGTVDTSNAQPETFGPNGFGDPTELLAYLKENKPEMQLQVLSHGDFCLPNIFADDGQISGFIDLGKCGVADIWQDVALCYRSLCNNYNGTYGGRSYPGFQPEMLFDALGLRPDWDKIRYYILLDELF